MNPSNFNHPNNVARRLSVAGGIPKLTAELAKSRYAHHDALYLVESAMREARHELTPEQYDALLWTLTDDERSQVAKTAKRPE